MMPDPTPAARPHAFVEVVPYHACASCGEPEEADIHKVSPTPAAPADVARQFHETYERLAPSFGYETTAASAVSWESVPLMNKRLMIAVVTEVLASLLAERDEADRQISRLTQAHIEAEAELLAAEAERDEARAAQAHANIDLIAAQQELVQAHANIDQLLAELKRSES